MNTVESRFVRGIAVSVIHLRSLLFLIVAAICPFAAAQQSSDLSASEDSVAPAAALALPKYSPGAARAPRSVPPGPALRAPDMVWVENMLAQMTLSDKIGQMLMPGYSSGSAATNVNTYRVGGFIIQGNSNTAPAIVNAVNSLQGMTSVPLLFSVDCEAGLGARFTDATKFPMNMASGAVNDTALAFAQGGVTARECRAIGIQVGFGPVLDVNTEWINPIIGIRSYSDQPQRVAQLAQAYVQGANAEGLLCTYKHYPGHGPTTGDSHIGFQQVNIPMSELQDIHLKPYELLLQSNTVDLVMTAHVLFPAIDPTQDIPATISYNALTGILRNQLGYTGCIISDSFAMGGLMAITNTYDGVTSGVMSGLDIILTPQSMADAWNGLHNGVSTGQIPLSRIDDSVRRILMLKSRAGIPESTTVSTTAYTGVLQHPDNLAAAREIAIRAVSRRNIQPDHLPIAPTESTVVFTLNTNNTIFYRYPISNFMDELRAVLPGATIDQRIVATTVNATTRNEYVTTCSNYNRVIVAGVEKQPTIYPDQAAFVNQLRQQGIEFTYLSFGSPYHVLQFPGLENVFCTYSSHYESQREVARQLAGVGSADQEWPVTVPVRVSAFVVD